jgi:hypothetical protein
VVMGSTQVGSMTVEPISVETQLRGTISHQLYWSGLTRMSSGRTSPLYMQSTTAQSRHGRVSKRSTWPWIRLKEPFWILDFKVAPFRLHAQFLHLQAPRSNAGHRRGSIPWWPTIDHHSVQGLNKRAEEQSDPPCQYLDKGERR